MPSTVPIGNTNIDVADFLYIAAQATVNIKNGVTTPIESLDMSIPSNGYDNFRPGLVNQATYVDFAKRIVEYMNNNHVAPYYGMLTVGSSTGQVSYQAQIYLLSRALAYYQVNGTLPSSLTVNTWNSANIPIKEPASYTISQITAAAVWLKNYIETNKAMPGSVPVGSASMDVADFLYLAAQATVNIKNGITSPVTSIDMSVSTSGYDEFRSGQISLASYVNFAQRIVGYMNDNGIAPYYGMLTIGSSVGKVSYQAQIYLLSRALAYYQVNGTLPSSLTVNTWNSANIPITEPSGYSVAQITTAAVWLKNYIETNKAMPGSVPVGSASMDVADFLYLAAQATVNIKNGITSPIVSQNMVVPSSGVDELYTNLLSLAGYVDFAQRIVGFMNDNGVAPTYGCANVGKVSYQGQIYLYSRVLAYYQSNGVLPSNIVVRYWYAPNIPTTGTNVAFTISDIANASTNVKNCIENNKALPSTVNIGSITVNVAQYLYLATKATVQIKNGDTSAITVGDFNLPSYSNEQLISGSITLVNFVDFAGRIVGYMVSNGVAPPYGYITIGSSASQMVNYQSQIYTFSKILDYYKTNNVLPSTVSIKPWSSVVYSIPQELIPYLVATANCQVANSQIQGLTASIVAGATTPYEKAVRIFNWVRDNLSYSFYYNTMYGAVGALNAGTGNCVDTAHLLIALERAAGIPARYEHLYAQFSSGNWYGHVVAQVWIDGTWYWADASSNYNTFGAINNWNTGTATYYGTYASLPF